jgi:DNA-binding GntR family transcriptional regulator
MNWHQVRELIIGDISRGGRGVELDSDAAFAKRAGCSVPTVKRAMADLAQRGIVVRRRGKRTKSSEQPAVVSGSDFSFGHSASERGCEVVTRLLEKSCRLPCAGSGADVELRAQSLLGLRRNQPFLVIARRRDLDGCPRVIHRSYLNPSYFPPTFLADHDFENESLLATLESYGLHIRSRQTHIRATLPTDAERELLAIDAEPVLNVEQSLFAVRAAASPPVVAEYLHATYSRWEYVINDRR